MTMLPEADRTDTCVTSHTTPVRDRVLAGGVQCQACHAGAEAHATSQGTLRTGGTNDCRTCHDAKHDPGFQRENSWTTIKHQLEPVQKVP